MWRPGRAAGEGFIMHAQGLDLARANQEQDTGQSEPRGPRQPLAERVFAALYPNWRLISPASGCIAVPRDATVIAGPSLSAVVGEISAAARRCPNGTGWPARSPR